MRIQVNVSDVMVEKIDKYAQMMGVSRSGLCGVLIGHGIMGYDKAFDMVDNIMAKHGEKMLEGQVELSDLLDVASVEGK